MAENIIDDIANVNLKNLNFENLSHFWNLLKPYIAEQVNSSGTTIDSEMSDASENTEKSTYNEFKEHECKRFRRYDNSLQLRAGISEEGNLCHVLF